MSADAIIYCLQEVTDYDQFERLCHDMMALSGYPGIEPLGGSKDKGRDALHVCKSTGASTVFAYSVREDWLKKLTKEDAPKIGKWNHKCDELAFLTTAHISAGERDHAVRAVADQFGLTLTLFPLERLRTMLATTCASVVAKHPSIFVPPFFPQAGGVSLAEAKDYLIVDCGRSDETFATWLSRRLNLAGYHVWCRTVAPIAGYSLVTTVNSLVKNRAFRYVPIISESTVDDVDYSARRAGATALADQRVIPIVNGTVDVCRLDASTRAVEQIHFDDGWAKGLATILELLEKSHCPHASPDTSSILRSFMPPDVLKVAPEQVSSNRFRILATPVTAIAVVTSKELSASLIQTVSADWAFRKVGIRRAIALHEPPAHIRESLGATVNDNPVDLAEQFVEGIRTDHLLPELIRKSLEVACFAKGLLRCEQRGRIYFPEGIIGSERLYFIEPAGSRNFFQVTGQRKLWRPTGSSLYRYALGPRFRVNKSPDGSLVIEVRVDIRITDDQGELLPGRSVNARRKHLTNSWFNAEWFARTIGLMQWLGGNGDRITIGHGDSRIEVATAPESWTVQVSICEEKIPNAKTSRQEVMAYAKDDDDQEAEVDDG